MFLISSPSDQHQPTDRRKPSEQKMSKFKRIIIDKNKGQGRGRAGRPPTRNNEKETMRLHACTNSPTSLHLVLLIISIAFILPSPTSAFQPVVVNKGIPVPSNNAMLLRFKPCVRRASTTRTTHTHHTCTTSRATTLQMFLLENVASVQAIGDAYSSASIEYPFVTNGFTGFTLSGIGDIVAQVRGFRQTRMKNASNSNSGDTSPSLSSFTIDYLRLGRFATRGFFGALIWSTWYDLSDNLYNDENISRILTGFGVDVDIDIDSASDVVQQTNQNDASVSINVFRIFMLMMTEQFIACPIIYGLWDIPVATILNGGFTPYSFASSVSKIPYEIKDKLRPMLIDNFKIWTPANIFIYSSPVEYRLLISNLGNILWQSIVSDFAADCGVIVEDKEEEEECDTSALADDKIQIKCNIPRDDDSGWDNYQKTSNVIENRQDHDSMLPSKTATETEVLV